MWSIPSNAASKRRFHTIVHSPPNTPGHLDVISTAPTGAEAAESVDIASETEPDIASETEPETASETGPGDNDENLAHRNTSSPWSINNQLGLPDLENPILPYAYWCATCAAKEGEKEPETELKDVAIQTEGDIEVKSVENNPKKSVLLEKENQAQHASLNIEMTGGTINKPVFNVVTQGGGKRKSTTEDQTTAKKTKRAKLIFDF